jgi:hypothetical protein
MLNAFDVTFDHLGAAYFLPFVLTDLAFDFAPDFRLVSLVKDFFVAAAMLPAALETVFFVVALSDFTTSDLTISRALAPARPPTTAPTAAPSGPTNEPAAAPAAAPPTIPRPDSARDPSPTLFLFAITFSLMK